MRPLDFVGDPLGISPASVSGFFPCLSVQEGDRATRHSSLSSSWTLPLATSKSQSRERLIPGRIPPQSPLAASVGLRGAKREQQHSQKRGALRLPAEPLGPGGSRMTAEVAILNKIGIALAADSTVSIGDKTYNATNKLFTLSKHHPVGAMIWNATEFNSIPLELIIKEFREALGKKCKSTIAEYGSAFMRHLRTRSHVSKEDQNYNFRNIMDDFARTWRKRFLNHCEDKGVVVFAPKLSGDAARKFDEMLDIFDGEVFRARKNPGLKGITLARLSTLYGSTTASVVDRLFKSIRPSAKQRKRMIGLLHRAALSNYISDDYSGIVIAGYGSKEYYPAVISFQMDGMFANRLKFVNQKTLQVSRANAASLMPFAQREAANLFMEGVDSTYQREINESVSDLIEGIAESSAKYYGISDQKKIDEFGKILRKTGSDYVEKLYYMRLTDAKKVLDAIKFLDKAEMAILAENIVSLTALKQKISLETETVGGPIDVAFISKNDGFIWIKRKHYFNRDLNPFFFEKYLSGTPAGSRTS